MKTISATIKPAKAWLPTPWRSLILRRLKGLQQGCITLLDGTHRYTLGQANAALNITVTVHNPAAYRRLALRGSIGVAEGYMAGEWSCDNLTDLVRLFVLNRELLNNLERGPVHLAMPIFRFGHWLRRNNPNNSRNNIVAHYDLGNEFYQLFLDQNLMYSCAVFNHPDSSLEQAATAKLERICQKLQLNTDDHVLEIGTGWGGFALYAAEHYGCRVTTTTISPAQYELACQRVKAAGLQAQVTVLQQDYRDLQGQYDKLVSIEMLEAVGHQHFNRYFEACSQLLKDHGQMLLQTITIADQEYARARKAVDFIQKYIFPGGCLPSITALSQSITQSSDLRIIHLEDIGPHYVLTLQHWRERFFKQIEQVRAQGYSEPFIRMWEYYLCYCEGGFAERALGTAQLLLHKPYCRSQHVLGHL